MVNLLLGLFVLLLAAPFAAAQETVAPPEMVTGAQRLLDKYIALEHAFDPAIADLYAPGATIRTKRTYPTGEVRELTIPVNQYKELIRQMMPIARASGDISRYSACAYTEGDTRARVRVRCTRYSVLKDYSSPVSFLVGPSRGGEWLIFEELSESQP
jgi:hypothetical protein